MKVRGELTIGWVAAAVAMTIITVTTIIGNSVMLVAVRRAQRAPVHSALTSLLAADLLVGLCVLPTAALRELFVFHLPWPLCACWSTMDVLCCTASILSLCALGWERWWGITAPLAASKRAARVKTLVATLWPLSTIIALPTSFIPTPKHFLPGEVAKACTVNTNIVYVFSSVSFSFYIPTSVMVFFYTMILRSLAISPPIRAHRGRSPGGTKLQQKDNPVSKEAPKNPDATEKQQTQNNVFMTPKRSHLALPTALIPSLRHTPPPAVATSQRHALSSNFIPSPLRVSSPVKSATTLSSMIPRQRRATQIIVMLMSLFLLCWTPFFVMLPVDSLCECVWDSTWQWCTWLGYANSALNPLVYAAASPSVRRALPASLTSSSRSNEVPMTPGVRRS